VEHSESLRKTQFLFGSGGKMRKRIIKLFNLKPFGSLKRSVIPLNSIKELKKIFSWIDEPVLARDDIYDFDYVEDVNERRIRDAECLAVVVRNARPKTVLEVGTSSGAGTALISENAKDSRVHTINIPPEEIESGKGGILTTIALEKDKVGAIYRKKGCSNVTQIFANTASWTPNIGPIDVAFIDGCHDTKFVINDTLKILPFMQPGGFILWHDANPELAEVYHWIGDVCRGLDWLIENGHISGRLYWVRDSWICIWQVPRESSK
jgi:predicted O-methyltransferase YrrM